MRFLDRDLRVVPGSPRLPAGTGKTLLAPDGTRFAATLGNRLTVYRRGGRRLAAYPIPPRYYAQAWPSAHHVLLVNPTAAGGATGIRSLDVRTGRTRQARVSGQMIGSDVHDGRARLLLRRGGFGGSQLTVVAVGRGGQVVDELDLPAVPGSVPGDGYARLRGDRALATTRITTALVTLDGDAPAALPVDVPPGGDWRWVGDDLISDGTTVARIDRDTGAVLDRGTIPANLSYSAEPLTPYAGGLIAGYGRVRLDADLDPVAEQPQRAAIYGHDVFRVGRRIYFRYVAACHPQREVAVVADARTGRELRRTGGKRLGVLGGGEIDLAQEDECLRR